MAITRDDKGRRILVRCQGLGDRISEWKITDVSPKGMVKVQDEAFLERWRFPHEFTIIEWLDGPLAGADIRELKSE